MNISRHIARIFVRQTGSIGLIYVFVFSDRVPRDMNDYFRGSSTEKSLRHTGVEHSLGRVFPPFSHPQVTNFLKI